MLNLLVDDSASLRHGCGGRCSRGRRCGPHATPAPSARSSSLLLLLGSGRWRGWRGRRSAFWSGRARACGGDGGARRLDGTATGRRLKRCARRRTEQRRRLLALESAARCGLLGELVEERESLRGVALDGGTRWSLSCRVAAGDVELVEQLEGVCGRVWFTGGHIGRVQRG
ncbi:hypothetical protein EXIGLDRAFT_511589 [Exidia glandulosa HHB12029]|uniref:Uncharacterized protein n=1 Tax=Exidia glandulosa HHB12029 TaxID=1314781 RepID=A0A165PEC8_EXIGL|nr:hypothetical protein EXIGLDRAFT_511589 [Exidia glandulosa HHB12029]